MKTNFKLKDKSKAQSIAQSDGAVGFTFTTEI